jgi:hypothetical protein
VDEVKRDAHAREVLREEYEMLVEDRITLTHPRTRELPPVWTTILPLDASAAAWEDRSDGGGGGGGGGGEGLAGGPSRGSSGAASGSRGYVTALCVGATGDEALL